MMFKFIIGYIILMVVVTFVIIGFIVKGCQHIDNNGGIKAVVERVWEGKK